MKVEANAKLVTVYVNSTDQWHGRSLYEAIVQLARQQGLAGATVISCVEGYGAGGHIHTTRLLSLSESLPVRIEVVDLAERVEPFLAALEPMIGEGLVTIHDVHIWKYRHEPKGK